MSNPEEKFKINKTLIMYTIVGDVVKALGYKFQRMNDSEVITTADGDFLPGEAHDSRAFDVLNFDLPENSSIYADSAYTDYETEYNLNEQMSINLMVQRKKPSNRQDVHPIKLLRQLMRKRIETTFYEINQLLPKRFTP